MAWLLPWVLLFFFLIFCGMFILVWYATRMQDKALQDILHQQRAMRLELDRLATALDALLADRPLNEDEGEPGATRPDTVVPPEAVPGLDRLLLGPDADRTRAVRPPADAAPGLAPAADGLPDLKL